MVMYDLLLQQSLYMTIYIQMNYYQHVKNQKPLKETSTWQVDYNSSQENEMKE